MVIEYPKSSKHRLTDHFNVSEFSCKCTSPECNITYIDTDLIAFLEKARINIGLPLRVNSGFRCTRHNKEVGGKKGSIHLMGKAADIMIPNGNILGYLSYFSEADGLGVYKTFIHVDVRGYMARWEG